MCRRNSWKMNPRFLYLSRFSFINRYVVAAYDVTVYYTNNAPAILAAIQLVRDGNIRGKRKYT